MSNQQRMVKEQIYAVPVVAAANTAISVGDMLWYDAGNNSCLPASSLAWNNTLAQTQQDFANVYLGVSLDARLATQTTTGKIMVATRGTYKPDCAALGAAVDLGTPYGPAKASGNALENQKVVDVANNSLAIGRLAKAGVAGDTSVEIAHVSKTVFGGAL